MTTTTVPRPPRLDLELLFIAMLFVASGVTLFAACSNDAHAARPSRAAAGDASIASNWDISGTGTFQTTTGQAMLWSSGNTFTLGAAQQQRNVDEVQHLIDRIDDVTRMLIVEHMVARAEPPILKPLTAAMLGAAIGVVICSLALRRYAIVGLRARRWVGRAYRSLQQHYAQRSRSSHR